MIFASKVRIGYRKQMANSTSSMEFEESDVIEIIPAEEYDAHRAKLKASISWILTKAYGNDIPTQIKDPFYEDTRGQLQIKPQLVNLLTSSEIYCQACSNMFSDTSSQWQGHWNIIQVLSRKGIYVAEAGETSVTETVLMHTAPFKKAAHLALIDALMKAYASEIASVERIVQAVRRYSSFNASSELPSAVEEALVFWINKTCAALIQRGDLEIIQGESNQKVRIVSKTTPRDYKSVPQMKDLMNDLGDGCCVAATIAFYQPDAFPVTDVCLKECVGIADSLYNLRLIRTFCEQHLALKCFHFTYEDLLYGREALHENVLVFLAELFFLLEASEQGESEKKIYAEGSSHVSGRRFPGPSIPQVSSATKRSFQKTSDEGRHHIDKISSSPSGLSARQPLLQRRAPSRRSHSLSSPQERDVVRRSVFAWQDDQNIQDRSSHNSTLLENVSVSWELDNVCDADLDAVSSADLAEFEATGHHQSPQSRLIDPSHPEFMAVTSITPGQASARSTRPISDLQEPLMPAKLRHAKEKINNHSKAEERGDRTPKKKMISPTKPVKGKLSPPGSSQGRVSPGGGSGLGVCVKDSDSQRSGGSSADETVVTPLASADLLVSHSADTVTSSSEASAAPPSQQSPLQPQESQPPTRHTYEAFTVASDSVAEALMLSPRKKVIRPGVQGVQPTHSYTLDSTVHDSQTAREAGLPIIGHSTSDFAADGDISLRHLGLSREGSIGSSRSSGDFSDHESHKIHQDHKARESLKNSPQRVSDLKRPDEQLASLPQSEPVQEDASKQSHLIIDHLSKSFEAKKKPGTTSFAEIRRMKDIGNVDNSGVVYMQHSQEPDGNANGPSNRGFLKSAFMQKSDGSGKRTAFAQLPNETSWQQAAQRSTSLGASSSASSDSAASNGQLAMSAPATSELSQLRLKLEEKRREIERKKQRQELQTAKMRQRLGKAAFMRVIAKPDEPTSLTVTHSVQPSVPGWRGGDDMDILPSNATLSHALLQERLGQVAPNEASRPTTLTTLSPVSSNSTSASESPSGAGRGFSREGIQQTIDGVRRRWFHGSDPEGDLIRSKDQADDEASGTLVSDLNSDMMQSCPPSVAAAAFGYSALPSSTLDHEVRASLVNTEASHNQTDESAPVCPQVRQLSQSPRRTPERRVSSGSGEQDDYDQSLDRLNRSLTELQGEIKRLTLQQQEQFRATQSAESELATSHHQQSIPPIKTAQTEKFSIQSGPLSNQLSHMVSQSLIPSETELTPSSSSHSSHSHLDTVDTIDLPQEIHTTSQGDDSTSGFFVSLGEDTPRRPKPKLGKEKDSAIKNDINSMSEELQRVPPLHGGAVGAEATSSHSDSHHSVRSGSDDASSGVSFVLGQVSSAEDEHLDMLRKKERFMHQQLKRKEEQERKRLEKEREIQHRQQLKMMEEEDKAKKKAEEKVRRETIFNEYLQKKKEQTQTKVEEKSPSSAAVIRRDRSNHNHTRPKSMIAKAHPLPSDFTDLGSEGLHPHSSQEDLSSHSSPAGSTAPLSPFRLNPTSRGKMRKAVSCNQLTQNGSPGTNTYRRPPSPRGRPPSPDLLRLKRGGARSHDSGSDTGSNTSDYTGPKLFVKPSAKSNRHIINNAISYCCLAGIVNTDLKNKVLEEIARSNAKHFLILFRDHGCQYRGLYSFDPDSEEAFKILGVGPRQLSSDMVERFYKYNSGGKSFTEVTSTKHLSVSIDAVVLLNVYWKSKVAAAARR